MKPIQIELWQTQAGNWVWGHHTRPITPESLKRRGTCLTVCAAQAMDHFRDAVADGQEMRFKMVK